MLIQIFLKVLDLSKAASIVIVLVLLARLVLRRAPKVFSYGLWAVVLLRLLCPVHLTAPVSLMPELDSVARHYTLTEAPISPLDAGFAAYQAIGDALNGGLGIQHVPTQIPDGYGGVEHISTTWWEVWVLAGQYLWLAGVVLMAVYALRSWRRLRGALLTASPVGGNIYLADGIPSPFVMGLLRPKIYLPSSLEVRERSWIVVHEQHHIRRKDHIFKALGFLALSIHWFNPLVWLAFVLAGRDMEMSCDEAVVKQLGPEIRADYTRSLLQLATGRRILAGVPLAFGEGDTKGRICNLARWKRPRGWVVGLCLVLCLGLGIALLTDPVATRRFSMNGTNVSELDAEQIVSRIAKINRLEDPSDVRTNGDNFEVLLSADFSWQDSSTMGFYYVKEKEYFHGQLRLYPEEGSCYVTESVLWTEQSSSYLFQLYLEAFQYLPQARIRELVPEADGFVVTMVEEGRPDGYEQVITYTPAGAGSIDGWYIHLQLIALYAAPDGGSTGGEVIHLFYDREQENAELVPGTTYVPYRCVYMNPASSYFPAGGDSGYTYTVHEQGFSIHPRRWSGSILQTDAPTLDGLLTGNAGSSIGVVEWGWQDFPYTPEEWEAMHLFSTELFPAGLSLREDIQYQPLSKDLFLLRVNGELWLVDLNQDSKGRSFLWSIYQLVPQGTMGVAQWEFTPTQSSRKPVLTIDFDLEYTQISAFCDGGMLTEFNYGDLSDHALNIPAGQSLHWAPSTLPDTGMVCIRFSIERPGERDCYGSLYLTYDGADELGNRRFTVELVGTGLHLTPTAEGAVISMAGQ